MSEISSFRDLVVWQKTFSLGLAIYELSKQFPDHERFGLTSQLRRGAVAVASNIAEGYGRESTQDYLRFLRMARGALFEINTQPLFAVRLGYLEERQYSEVFERIRECGRILAGLIRSLES